VRAAAHPRWRPAYYLDVEVGGETIPLYFRGDRGEVEQLIYPLEHETRVLVALERHGIKVPHVYGFCEDPRGIVLERVEGRPNLATADSPEEARAVLDEFVDLLARMHQIDVRQLGDLELKLPESAEEMALGDIEHWIQAYRKQKVRPDPLIEFLIRWVHANVPPGRHKVALLQGDPGQFLFDKGRVTAMIDLELACFGDPAADLAGLFARDLSEPMPSLADALARYAEKTGEAVDPRVVMYHAIRFNLTAPLSMAHIVAEPPADTEFIQYMAWHWVCTRVALEWVAKLEGVDLVPWMPPAEVTTRYSSGHDFLEKALSAASPEDTMVKYQLSVAARAATYLRRADRWGPALDEEDLDEAAAILGSRPASWQECDSALEKLVLDNEPEPGIDARLLQLLYRRCLRHEWLLKPALRELTDASFQPLEI
jgi:aminoglycoside phosphotransferase (APT) family kinase protein